MSRNPRRQGQTSRARRSAALRPQIDALEIRQVLSQVTLLDESFNTFNLGFVTTETWPFDKVYTHTSPSTFDQAVNDPAMSGGVDEWFGWSFTRPEFWSLVADDQGRSAFTLGQGIIAVADSDEWDDIPNSGPASPNGPFNSVLPSKSIDLTGVATNTLVVEFDSSWRWESLQTATLTATYTLSGGGTSTEEVLRWESNAELSPGVPNPKFKPDAPNEHVLFNLNNPANATAVSLSFKKTGSNNWWWAFDNLVVRHGATNLVTENFESLVGVLAPALDETNTLERVWTRSNPAGWGITTTGMSGGPEEWRGWSFVQPAFWEYVSGDEGRSSFTKGSGIIAAADPDRWSDFGAPVGTFNSTLSTPLLDLTNMQALSGELTFDSSWRPSGTQTASLIATYNLSGGGTSSVTLFTWQSNAEISPGVPNPNFKPEFLNERITVPLNNPVGATAVDLDFVMSNAGNDWFWAIDDVVVTADNPTIIPIFFEDFDAVPLQPSRAEYAPTPPLDQKVWSPNGPAGWTVDRSKMPANGVPELVGWSFVNRDWWVRFVSDQRRSQFTKGRGVIAVADNDEWDDNWIDSNGVQQSRIYSVDKPYFESFLETPTIAIPAGYTGQITLSFDSSWRPEGLDDDPDGAGTDFTADNNQTAVVDADFGAFGTQQLMLWQSDPNAANFKPAATNESVSLTFTPPAGATTVKLDFGMLKARNDWWWAIDNIQVALQISTFAVSEFASDSSGFTAWFSQPLDASDLNIVNSELGLGVSDIVVTSGGSIVPGSVVIDNKGLLTFLPTGGALPDGTYEVTLRSAADGFKSAIGGALLDGDTNNVAGGDFTRSFVVSTVGNRTLSIGDLTLGAEQSNAVPVTISNGLDVTQFQFELLYDPSLLVIDGVVAGADLPGGGSLVSYVATPGVLMIRYNGPALGSGLGEVVEINTSTPSGVAYGEKQVLDLRNIELNGGSIAVLGDNGFHLASFSGDVSGDGAIDGLDALFMNEFSVGNIDGFSSFQLADPNVVGDMTGDFIVDGLDALVVNELSVGNPVPFDFPPIPANVPSFGGGPDPIISLPRGIEFSADGRAIVPINLLYTDARSGVLVDADVLVGFDPSKVSIVGVETGTLSDNFGTRWSVDGGTLRVNIARSRTLQGQRMQQGDAAVIAYVVLEAKPGVEGEVALNLLERGTVDGRSVDTRLNAGRLTLIPRPTNGLDAVDGSVIVTPVEAVADEITALPRVRLPKTSAVIPAGVILPVTTGETTITGPVEFAFGKKADRRSRGVRLGN
ncbi:MAG: hypothetical protein SFX72_00130 [Isosphaeraceae bacterium]|nr:hypothetical protein [Isosphaeraceae bacterium]